MIKPLLHFLLILVGAATLNTQTSGPQYIPNQIVKQFCAQDVAGKRLSPVSARDLAHSLLITENVWEQPTGAVIIGDYSARSLRGQKDTAEFAVDYRVLGRIDSALKLTRLQAPYTNQPTLQSEHFSMVLSDTHSELGADGRLQTIRGVPEWRIKTFPSTPHVGIAAAMSYVRMAAYRSKDLRAKMNAEKTLEELQNLYVSPMIPTQGATPDAILSQFIEMQMDGRDLSAQTAQQTDVFFVHPVEWRTDKIGVARAYTVKTDAVSFDKADCSVQYGAIGEIDWKLKFTSSGPSGNLVRQSFEMQFDNKYSLPGDGNAPEEEFAGPSRWRIQDAPTEQWISVAAAIRYVTEIRDATKDPTIKANADKTLADLARYR